MTKCGCEGYFDKEIEDVNIAAVSLNSSKRNIFYEINWI